MERESGCKSSPIWLIGDSPPKNWKDELSEPFDSRHPARHNIWTPVVDGIQELVYRQEKRRVDTSRLYVRNAVHNWESKVGPYDKNWSQLKEATEELGGLLGKHKPKLVFTFGAFAFEFANRSLGKNEKRAYRYWTTERLGKQFRLSVAKFPSCEIDVVPLLHTSISRGKYLVSHKHFTCAEDGNYFDYVADKVSALLLNHKDDLDIWIS